MSEVFDPEKVERVQCYAPFKDAGGWDTEVVDALDYDTLLLLYLDAKKSLNKTTEKLFECMGKLETACANNVHLIDMSDCERKL